MTSGNVLTGLFTRGLGDIIEAAKAVSLAAETKALSIDPHVVDTMLKKLTDMQDALTDIQRKSSMLETKTPLGGGYAEEIGRVNGRLGEQVLRGIIPEMIEAIGDLKTQIDKSRASIQNVDEAIARTHDNL